MKPDSKQLGVIGHNIVIDNGTNTVKGGFSTADAPQCRIPTLVGHGRHKGAMSSLGLKDCYVGSKAQSLRGILSISHPIRQGVVQSWEDLETIWTHIVEQELQAEAAAQPMLVTQMPLASAEDEARMAEILVESLGVPAMFVANKSVMSLYGGGNMTGISVDSGHDTTYLVPSYQGNAIQDATLVLKIGGKQVTEHLMNLLMNGKYSFPDDNFLLWRKKKKTKFTVSSRKEIIREMKEQYCTVSPNYTSSYEDSAFPETSVRLPDGNMIVMGRETFMAPEIMFQPSLASKKSCGLSQLIYYSVLKCDEKIRPELLSNITLSGGNTKFPGFEKRLYQELSELFEDKTNIKVRSLPNRELLGWIGGARLSNLSSFQRFWLTKADYQENGPVIVHDNSKIFEDIKNSNSEVKAA